MRPAVLFPDYELTDHNKTQRRLSELQGADPMILVIARGHFCPKDHQQHLELAAFYPKIAVAYTRIVTISTDNIIETREFRASVGAQWTFLSDAGRKVQKDLDIQEYTDPYHDPMIPHTLVFKPELVIHSLYNGYWFWGRPSIEDLRHDLRQATRDIRPDWDLSTPGLRAAGTPVTAPAFTRTRTSSLSRLGFSRTHRPITGRQGPDRPPREQPRNHDKNHCIAHGPVARAVMAVDRPVAAFAPSRSPCTTRPPCAGA